MSTGHIVVQGASCECQFGNAPDDLVVESQSKEFINDSDGSKKLVGNTMDIGMPFKAKTFGQCKLQPTPSGYLSCIPNIQQWQDFYDKIELDNGGNILTEKSKGTCAISGTPCVKFTWHGQTAQSNSSNVEQTDEETQSYLNPLVNIKQMEMSSGELECENFDQNDDLALHKNFSVIKVEGPFDLQGNKIKYISPKHKYFYHATLKDFTIPQDINKVKWSVSYDDDGISKIEQLGKGGVYKNGKLIIELNVNKGRKKATIYAHINQIPETVISTTAIYKQVVTFFIGGAADKESFYGAPATEIMKDVKENFNEKLTYSQYQIRYLGYNEIKGEDDIKNNVINIIPNKDGTFINLVGHSLGGWNGAHLSKILSDKGYTVDMLITLDPVGEGAAVTMISDIYFSFPKPKANYWISISTDPKNYRFDDGIADAGGQWRPAKKDPKIYHDTKFSHGQAQQMFTENIKNNISASDMLLHFINYYLEEK